MMRTNPHAALVHKLLGPARVRWSLRNGIFHFHSPALWPTLEEALRELLEHARNDLTPPEWGPESRNASGTLHAHDGAVMLEYCIEIETKKKPNTTFRGGRPLKSEERVALETNGAQGLFASWSGGGDQGSFDSVEWVGGPRNMKALPPELMTHLGLESYSFSREIYARMDDEGGAGSLLWLTRAPTDPAPEVTEFLNAYKGEPIAELLECTGGFMFYVSEHYHQDELEESEDYTLRLEQSAPSAGTEAKGKHASL